jgi:hypothetical protein
MTKEWLYALDTILIIVVLAGWIELNMESFRNTADYLRKNIKRKVISMQMCQLSGFIKVKKDLILTEEKEKELEIVYKKVIKGDLFPKEIEDWISKNKIEVNKYQLEQIQDLIKQRRIEIYYIQREYIDLICKYNSLIKRFPDRLLNRLIYKFDVIEPTLLITKNVKELKLLHISF